MNALNTHGAADKDVAREGLRAVARMAHHLESNRQLVEAGVVDGEMMANNNSRNVRVDFLLFLCCHS